MSATTARLSGTASGSGIRQALRDGSILAWRYLKRVPRIPELAIFAIIQSIMFVLLFAYVFGGAIPLPGGGNYREFLMPGIFAQTIAFAASSGWNTGGTGCARFGRRLRTQSNCGVLTAGSCTIVTVMLLPSCSNSHRSESQKPWTACFAAQYAACRGIPRYASAEPTCAASWPSNPG